MLIRPLKSAHYIFIVPLIHYFMYISNVNIYDSLNTLYVSAIVRYCYRNDYW